jgi:hypothetical protein
MVIGNGDIASVLPDREDFLYFASGVSNSRETRKSEFDREVNLLMEQGKKRRLVYFTSLAVLDRQDTPYFKHKRHMEELAKTFPKYTIVRIGNINWGYNPHTIINSFKNDIKNGKTIRIKDEYRFIVDKDEFLFWVNKIPDFNCEITIIGKRMKVVDLLKNYVL